MNRWVEAGKRVGVALCLMAGTLAAAGEDELAQRCDELAAQHQLSGVVLVTAGDEVLVERAYGLANTETKAPIETDTPFLVASLTKPVVAFLTLRLVEADVLALEDAVSQHIDELKDAPAGQATIHQLLTHTSGLPHYYEAWPGFLDDVTVERSADETLALFRKLQPTTEPGEAFQYSGPGYLLLGTVLERASGQSLASLLQTRVFEPLGMESSALLTTHEGATYARPYERSESGLEPAPLRHPSTLQATGGVVTTARDLHRFARAVQQATLLTGDLHDTLLKVERGQYACGLIVYEHPWTRARFARHKGSMDGVSAHIVFGLEDDRVAITLSNVGRTPVEAINDSLILRVSTDR